MSFKGRHRLRILQVTTSVTAETGQMDINREAEIAGWLVYFALQIGLIVYYLMRKPKNNLSWLPLHSH
jgi:hypothetical protein